ncbi:MAG: hypothetical protein MMC23_005184 [Stictis urceolatum]|nr:hypothetical protein [Stictis urceolata]
MRFSRKTSPILLSILALLSSSNAKPLPKEQSLFLRAQNVSLELRQCAVPCGWESQYCCSSDQKCYTSNGIAGCSATAADSQAAQTGGGGGGGYQLYTTTYTETDLRTITSTWSVMATPGNSYGGTPTATGDVTATALVCGAGQESCGSWLCCDSSQMCISPGQCGAKSSNSAFIRPTSNTVATVTSTAAATTTEAFQTPVASDGSNISAQPDNNGLSGGAIAGIVIGVLLGLFLLFLLLACLCCKGLIDGLLALFGCGKKRRTEETYIETHHSHHGSHGPPPKRRWFGMAAGPSRPKPEKKSGIGFLGVAGILGTLAVILGLKRKHDRHHDEKSSYGSVTSYSYSDDYTTSASSASSDRRTRTTRHSRR